MTTPVLLFACVVAYAAAQCGPSDHPNCVYWARNGFCNNAGYTLAMKQQYCPRTCPGICGPVPTAPPVTQRPNTGGDANANCRAWYKDNAFCVDPRYASRIKQYCSATCAFEIAPYVDCAVYSVSSGAFTRVSTSNRTPAPGTAVAFSSSASVVPSYVYARSGCTVTLFDQPPIDVVPGTTAPGQTLSGNAGNFQKITNTAVSSYSCTCP